MKKVFVMVLLFSAMVFALPVSGFAEGVDYGRENIENALPDEAREFLYEKNITPENSGALGLSFWDALSEVFGIFRGEARKPLVFFAVMCGVILLCALAESLCEGGSLKGVFSVVGVVCGAGTAAGVMYEIIDGTLSTLSRTANFMMIIVPAIAGIAAVMGHFTSAAAINSVVIAATQLFSQLAVNFLAPLCGSIMGLSLAGAVHPQFGTEKLAELVKKFVIWGLTLIMTVFMSVLSVQTLVASASDNTAIKTAKFLVSQGVPIIGSTISDAVNTFGGSLSLLKGSVGTYGIIAAAVILFPGIARIVCYKLALLAAGALAEMFSLKELSTLIKSCRAITTIILAVSVCFLLLNFSALLLLLAATG